ncbi:MAG: LacI family DNA-binding transcriptional regulator [Candidatus Sumerlaeota bacterium]
MSKIRPTIRDLAALAGFSKSTISAALAGDPRVKTETRQKIQDVAREAGYKPHPHFRILGAQRRNGHSGDETLVFFVHSDDRERKPRFQASLDHAEEVGYKTELWPIDNNTDYHELADTLYHRGIRGIMLVWGCKFLAPHDFPWDRFACVATGYHTGPVQLDRIRHDPFLAVRMAFQKMIEAGWRKIGGYFPYDEPTSCIQDEQRVAAFEYYQKIFLDPKDILPPLQCPFQMKKPFRDWFVKHRPEALVGVVSSPVTDPAFLAGIAEPPPFVSLQIGRSDHSVAGIDVHSHEVQISAVDWLEDKLRLGQFGLSTPTRRMMIEPEWIEGRSLWKKR